jgi:hypothetical protein
MGEKPYLECRIAIKENYTFLDCFIHIRLSFLGHIATCITAGKGGRYTVNLLYAVADRAGICPVQAQNQDASSQSPE